MDFITPSIFCVCGSMGSGKSTSTKSILYQLSNKFDYGYLICPVMQENNYDYIPDGFKYYELTDKILRQILRNQLARKEENKKNNCFLIIDDGGQSTQKSYSKLFEHLVQMHRHYNITLFYCTQFLKFFPTFLRSLANYFILTSTLNGPGNYQEAFKKTPIGAFYNNYKEFMADAENKCINHKCICYCSEMQRERNKCYITISLPPNFKFKY